MYDIEKIGKVIKRARVEKKISQEAMAEVIDITPTHLKHIESGHRKPSVEVLFDIFNELNISFDELKTDDSEEADREREKVENILDRCETNKLKLIGKIAKVIADDCQ